MAREAHQQVAHQKPFKAENVFTNQGISRRALLQHIILTHTITFVVNLVFPSSSSPLSFIDEKAFDQFCSATVNCSIRARHISMSYIFSTIVGGCNMEIFLFLSFVTCIILISSCSYHIACTFIFFG